MPWAGDAWATVEPPFLRGGLIAELEKLAQVQGVPIIDVAFVSRAISTEKALGESFAVSLVTTQAEKKRKGRRGI